MLFRANTTTQNTNSHIKDIFPKAMKEKPYNMLYMDNQTNTDRKPKTHFCPPYRNYKHIKNEKSKQKDGGWLIQPNCYKGKC